MKGIILAGGAGTRLYPATRAVSKQLLPVYDKPMIYYPVSVLMLAGIRDLKFSVISTPVSTTCRFSAASWATGRSGGSSFSYAEQPRPEGLAQALVIGREFVGHDSVCLILGDNIFFGQSFGAHLKRAAARETGATVFGYYVRDPERYGVVEFDGDGKAVSIEEKPARPKSHYAITGLYFYDNEVLEFVETSRPPRGASLKSPTSTRCI